MEMAASTSLYPKALVVNDDPIVRHLARESLSAAGLRVVTAETGRQGLALFGRFQPDIVLLDLTMPEVDGFAVCEEMRGLDGADHVPIMVMTGPDDTGSINRAYQAGATDFVTKPIDWAILNQRVRNMLRADGAIPRMRESRTGIRATLDTVPDLMFRINRWGVLLEAREVGTINICGPPGEMVGKRVCEVMPAEVASRVMEGTERALTTGAAQCFEYDHRADNSVHYHEGRMVAIEPDEVLFIPRDVTEARQIFEVRFPAVKGGESRKAVKENRERPTGNERILVVEDEPTLASLLEEIIERLGYQVLAKTSSMESLEVFRDNPLSFDLVLTDYFMPKMHGLELARRISALRSDLPIILCTGNAERMSPEDVVSAGIREVILKPVSIRRMAEVIRKTLDEAGRAPGRARFHSTRAAA